LLIPALISKHTINRKYHSALHSQYAITAKPTLDYSTEHTPHISTWAPILITRIHQPFWTF